MPASVAPDSAPACAPPGAAACAPAPGRTRPRGARRAGAASTAAPFNAGNLGSLGLDSSKDTSKASGIFATSVPTGGTGTPGAGTKAPASPTSPTTAPRSVPAPSRIQSATTSPATTPPAPTTTARRTATPTPTPATKAPTPTPTTTKRCAAAGTHVCLSCQELSGCHERRSLQATRWRWPACASDAMLRARCKVRCCVAAR